MARTVNTDDTQIIFIKQKQSAAIMSMLINYALQKWTVIINSSKIYSISSNTTDKILIAWHMFVFLKIKVRSQGFHPRLQMCRLKLESQRTH